jgi:hypothetical protein
MDPSEGNTGSIQREDKDTDPYTMKGDTSRENRTREDSSNWQCCEFLAEEACAGNPQVGFRLL